MPPSTDPVPPSTNQYHSILTWYHKVSTISNLYCCRLGITDSCTVYPGSCFICFLPWWSWWSWWCVVVANEGEGGHSGSGRWVWQTATSLINSPPPVKTNLCLFRLKTIHICLYTMPTRSLGLWGLGGNSCCSILVQNLITLFLALYSCIFLPHWSKLKRLGSTRFAGTS